jgi:L-ascorbate metabolism protein UlaG (beta-lactamase superfamily)
MRSILLIICAWFALRAAAQQAQLSAPIRLTNREVSLRITSAVGQFYRVDAATNLTLSNHWSSLVSFQSTGVNQHTDSAAPFSLTRFYRAEQLTNVPLFTGDHLGTTNGGDVVFRVINHASFLMSWNGKVIYNDPVGGTTPYAGLPKADLILVSHSHSDHYDVPTLNAQRAATGLMIVPQAVYNLSGFAALRPNAIVLHYGESTNVLGMNVLAVPGYNANHLYTNNNAYVITMGGRRIFTSGDTGDVPEIRALTSIDVAFVCMNTPFTMTAPQATNSVRAFRPSVVYPYHYRDSSNATTNAAYFKQILGLDSGTEVRLRKWY